MKISYLLASPRVSALLAAYVGLGGCLDERAPALEPTDSTVDVSEHDTSTDTDEAIITTGSAKVVRPGTKLNLDISLPPSLEAEIVGWQWSAIQPDGSAVSFQPNANIKNPTLEPWVIGDYVFRLALLDNTGRTHYAQEHRLMVAPRGGLHIELTWHTPTDPDETDTGSGSSWSAGSDVDLHLLHPRANGQYFDGEYDCYWEHTQPNWSTSGLDGSNPTLDRDDTDGAGPEVISLLSSEPDATYRVGVHYWNDWGYGTSLATIRIYIDGVLQDEWTNVQIVDGDMWESHEIDLASGEVRRLTIEDDEPQIIPMYTVGTGLEPLE